jgi:hypothetical protein
MKLVKIRNKYPFRRIYDEETDSVLLASGKYSLHAGHHNWNIAYDENNIARVGCRLDRYAFTHKGKFGDYILGHFEITNVELQSLYKPLYPNGVVYKRLVFADDGSARWEYLVRLVSNLGDIFYLRLGTWLAVKFDKCINIDLIDKNLFLVDESWIESDEMPEYIGECLDCVQAVQDFILEYMV